MGATKRLAIMPMALLVVACGKGTQPQHDTPSDALRSDLERAAAPTSELAASQFRPTQVVSALELGESRAPSSSAHHTRRPAPRVKPSPKPQVAPVEAVSLEPPPAPSVEPAPAPTTVAVTPAPTPPPGPRPTPNPVDYPGGDGNETDGDHQGGGIGGVIGVIIRGGVIGDDDHCEIHPGGRGRIPIAINTRFPIPGGGRIPRGGW